MSIQKIVMASLLLLLLPAAYGVEKRDALPLWFEDIDNTFGWVEHFNSIDFYPAVAGKEVIGFNESYSAETNGGNSRMVFRARIQVRNAANGNQISQFTITTKSDWHPNNDTTYDYFCNNEYSADLNPDNTIPECDTFLSAGVAEISVGGRYLVVATNSVIDYFDNISVDEVADVYKLHVYDLATDNLAWANSW